MPQDSIEADIMSLLWIGLAVLTLIVLGVMLDKRFARQEQRGRALIAGVAEALRRHFSTSEPSIEHIEGGWMYAYPRFLVRFASWDVLRRAEQSGLCDRIRAHAVQLVRADSRFGKQRDAFDPLDGIQFISEREVQGA